MLLFSTLLETNKKLTKDAFIKLVIEWNKNNPYEDNIIKGLEWTGDYNTRFGDENLWLAIEEYRNENIIAVRYEKRDEEGAVWDTDYVMNFKEWKMAIRLERSYLEEALTKNRQFSTPHFIKHLIEHDYLKKDCGLPVCLDPIIINDDNLEMMATIINGKSQYHLPIVYISKTIQDENPVDVGKLAYRLKGVAHILVQENRSTNHRLRELCNDENEYLGAIGIYYPNSTTPHRRFIYHAAEGIAEKLLDIISQTVLHYSNSQLTNALYTWQGVNNALLRDRLTSQKKERLAAEDARKIAEEKTMQLLDSLDEEEQKLKKQALEEARSETDKLLDAFENDMQKSQKEIEELTRINENLQYENQCMKVKLDTRDKQPLLYMGNEMEFYGGEIKDLILSILDDAQVPPKSRREHVLNDIVEANDYQKISLQRAEEIKRLLKNYDGMNGKLRQELKDLGFEITEDGKHYKVTYYGDDRYWTTFSKTPSSKRSGTEGAMTVVKTMF